ncbi:MAG: Fe-S cluster assembly ATPase SufC [Ardenticatenaceae bacterium]|nr:Fe-S cluster assembly ATPase SufC [Ardenticatenaceae bacterium]
MSVALEIKNLHVAVDDLPILKGVNLKINEGEIHALMGPNGSGKSTLAYTLSGHPFYEPTAGEVTFANEDVLEMDADERSRAGLFLAFQYPVAVPGVTVANFLRQAINSRRKAENPDDPGISIPDFRRLLRTKMTEFNVDHKFAGRYLNDGFSGGEKKRAEILQMAVLEPKMAVMDETDSGLDIDALKVVSDGANRLHKELGMGMLLITHYQRLLNYITPDYVHVMLDGRIVESGGPELAHELEEKGYEWVKSKHEAAAPA